MRRFATLAVSLLLAAHTTGAQSSPAPGRGAEARWSAERRRIDSLVDDAVASRRAASVTIAVVQGRDTITVRASGNAALDPERPASPATVYRLASLTKQFTSAIVLQLVAERKLSLADTVGRLLPWTPAAWHGVTVAQLLNHTSGIPNYTALGPVWAMRMAEDMSADTIIALTAARPMDFAPGTDWRYNNTGYVMLGRIIELVDGRPYADAVSARLAKPLGLSSLHYCPTNPVAPTDAAGYTPGPRRALVPSRPISLTQPFSAGALCASAVDLVRWNRALHGGRVVPAALYARMTTPEGPPTNRRYGYGIGRDSTSGRLRLSHNGGINGFNTYNGYWPDSALSVVILTNTEGGVADALAEQIRRVLQHEPLIERPKPIVLAADALAAFTGRYELTLPSRTLPVIVTIAGGALQAAFEGESPSRLLPIAPQLFMAEDDDQLRIEFTRTDGRVTGLRLRSGPQTFTGRRVGDAP